MSSLFKYPSQTAPVKIGPVKRAGQTCKPAKREKGQKRRETRGERRGRERECVCVKRASPRDGSHFRREEMRGERWRGERVSPCSSLRRNLFPTRERGFSSCLSSRRNFRRERESEGKRETARERGKREEKKERFSLPLASPRDGKFCREREREREREDEERRENSSRRK